MQRLVIAEWSGVELGRWLLDVDPVAAVQRGEPAGLPLYVQAGRAQLRAQGVPEPMIEEATFCIERTLP